MKILTKHYMCFTSILLYSQCFLFQFYYILNVFLFQFYYIFNVFSFSFTICFNVFLFQDIFIHIHHYCTRNHLCSSLPPGRLHDIWKGNLLTYISYTHGRAWTFYWSLYIIKTFIKLLSSIRPSTQHRLTTKTTWFNNNNK